MRFAALRINLKRCAAALCCLALAILAICFAASSWGGYLAGSGATGAVVMQTAAAGLSPSDSADIAAPSNTVADTSETAPLPSDVVTGEGAHSDNPDYLGDVGGEFTEEGEYDGALAVPANISLGRIEIAQTVCPPLSFARVSSLFGYRLNPVTGKYRFHSGLDLAAAAGTDIFAMYAGKVVTAGWDDGYGNYVILEHEGDFQTLYAHCSRLLCEAGDKVDAGEVIALVGSTGNSTGAHLHVEFRQGGKRYDPEWELGGIY